MKLLALGMEKGQRKWFLMNTHILFMQQILSVFFEIGAIIFLQLFLFT